jgi:signal transduction histidine kinase
VQADPDKLTQVLTNLVSNAIKYSPQGGAVTISAAEGTGIVYLSVADEGLGLPPEEVPRLFGRFHRIADRSRRRIRGTGLGLYITKHLVELQGGRIWAESPGAGLGSTFHVELLVAMPGDPSWPAEPGAQDQWTAHPS